LGNLKGVGGNLDLRGSRIKSLGNLKSVGGYLSLMESQIESLGNLKSVGRSIFIKNTKLTPEDFKNMKIGGTVLLI
jgi:hypothetical protein